jgi:hypothetical protein
MNVTAVMLLFVLMYDSFLLGYSYFLVVNSS